MSSKDSVAEPKCFNCDDTGTCIVYPRVESVVYADVPEWLTHPDLEWQERPCPYCREPDASLDYPFGGLIFFW